MRKINQSNIKWQGRVDTYRVKCFCIYFCSCFPGAALPFCCRGVCIPAAARSEGRAQTGGLKNPGWTGPCSQQCQRKGRRGALGDGLSIIYLSMNYPREGTSWSGDFWNTMSQGQQQSHTCTAKLLMANVPTPKAPWSWIPMLCSRFSSPKQLLAPLKGTFRFWELLPSSFPPSRLLLVFNWHFWSLLSQSDTPSLNDLGFLGWS